MRDPVALELRRQAARTQQSERRVAMMMLPGKVGPVDETQRKLRLKLGQNAKGEDILSPWMRWQEAGVGALSIHSQPAPNEQMMMVSASGTIGTGSIAVPASFDGDHPAPSTATDATVLKRSNGRIQILAENIDLIGNINLQGGTVTHDGVNISKTHAHTGVVKGGDVSGPPES